MPALQFELPLRKGAGYEPTTQQLEKPNIIMLHSHGSGYPHFVCSECEQLVYNH